jgi:prevent-host-death family protein
MQFTNIHDAKSQLSKLVQLAFEGEEIVICKAGKPMARLIQYKNEIKPRVPGYWQGKVTLSPDFDELPENLLSAFKGEKE